MRGAEGPPKTVDPDGPAEGNGCGHDRQERPEIGQPEEVVADGTPRRRGKGPHDGKKDASRPATIAHAAMLTLDQT